MKTKIVLMDEFNINEEIINEAGRVIKDGGLVAFPTETVYGLGANALNGEAVKKIFIAKGRPQDNPLIVHVSNKNINHLVSEIPFVAQNLINKFWPGPLTVILSKSKIIPKETCANLDTVGIRMPANQIALKLIESAGFPIAAPSANLSGRPSPTEVSRCIEDLEGKIDFIIGGDKSNIGLESTIVDCTEYPPVVLRPGGITLEMLHEIDENIYLDPSLMKEPSLDLKPKAPGMKYRHYAPKADVKIIEGDINKTVEKINHMIIKYNNENKKVGVLATDETKDLYQNCIVLSLGNRNNLFTVAQNLFEVLRSLDDQNVDIILSESFEENGVGIAIMNRLRKAAAFDIIKL
ncbi:MAG: Sua5/YciO/YrdC/YwlC family protein [Haloplasmataceae bacterium]|jgi:L-threonylcarbamoyladenylate synthase|nr:Sua5/YciO/YrdC/YwlC family protein [Haloplasmataceae bacterium]